MLAERDTKWTSSTKPGIFMTGMEYRWMPPIAKLIETTENSGLGNIRIVSIREHRFPFLEKVGHWNRFNCFTGGTLVEKACHFFDLMRCIVKSDPVSVYASGGQAMNHQDEMYDLGRPDILDHALTVIEFQNGVRASLDLCMFAEDEQTELVRVVCERGSVEAKSPESTLRVVHRCHLKGLGRTPPSKENRAVPQVISIPVRHDLAAAGFHEGATFFELTSFFEAARGLRPVPVTARDGKMAVLMGSAAQRSIETGRVIQLSPEGKIEPPTLPQRLTTALLVEADDVSHLRARL